MTEQNIRSEVAAASIKLPPFWKNNPALWFCQVESQFEIAGIRSDKAKFNYIVGCVESNVLAQVSDLILTRPENNMYDTLKTRILSCFTESAETRFKKLISEISLDGKRPSHLLREMKELAGTGINGDVLKSLWLQRLPVQVQTVLVISTEDVDKLAVMADKILDVSSFNDVCSVSNNSNNNNDLNQLFNDLKIVRDEIAELRKSRYNSVDRRYRSRSRSKVRNYNGLCFYHFRYKDKAHKCIQPCSFNKLSEN